jgi:hypothetical protein
VFSRAHCLQALVAKALGKIFRHRREEVIGQFRTHGKINSHHHTWWPVMEAREDGRMKNLLSGEYIIFLCCC